MFDTLSSLFTLAKCSCNHVDHGGTMEEREMPCCVLGYHIHRDIWAAAIKCWEAYLPIAAQTSGVNQDCSCRLKIGFSNLDSPAVS